MAITEKIFELLSSLVETVRNKNERDRAIWREQMEKRKQEEYNNQMLRIMDSFARNNYHVFAEILTKAINNTGSISQLTAVRRLDGVRSDNKRAGIAKNGVIYLQYKAWLKAGHEITADKLRRILQIEVNAIAGYYNLPKIIIEVIFREDDCVYVLMTYSNEAMRRANIW